MIRVVEAATLTADNLIEQPIGCGVLCGSVTPSEVGFVTPSEVQTRRQASLDFLERIFSKQENVSSELTARAAALGPVTAHSQRLVPAEECF